MTRNTLICGTLALVCGVFSKSAYSQNAQCTLLAGPNFGKVAPVTINPPPPLNAVCQVGGYAGYVSSTSSGLGVNVNSMCGINVAGHTLNIQYQASGTPVLNARCTIGNVSGTISSTSANVDAQCTLLTGGQFNEVVPIAINPAPPLNSSCSAGGNSGYVSSTSSSTGVSGNSMCTASVFGRLVTVQYQATGAPALNASCAIGSFAGHISSTSTNVNAQCTILTGSDFGQVVPVARNPAPPVTSPCQVGSDNGFISKSSSTIALKFNSVCSISSNGQTLNVPYSGNPAPCVNTSCKIGNLAGYISSSSATTGCLNASCTLLTGAHPGKVVPVTINPAPRLGAACQFVNDTGYVSKTSSTTGAKVNAHCTIAALGHTFEVPFYATPVPALDDSCQVANNVGGYVSYTTGPSNNANAQCTVMSPAFAQSTPSVGDVIPYYANPAPRLGAACKVGADVGFVSATLPGSTAANAVCTIVQNGKTIQSPFESHPAPPVGGAPVGSLTAYMYPSTALITINQIGELPNDGYLFVDNEEIQIVQNNPSGLIVKRGVNGTPIAAHSVGASLRLPIQCKVLGSLGTVTSSHPAWYQGSKPFDLVWVTDSDGSGLQQSGYDRNGYPLNPLWFSQIDDPTTVNNSRNLGTACGLPTPFTLQSFLSIVQSDLSACTTQHPQFDTFPANTFTGSIEEGNFGVCNQSDTIFPGHVNFYIATYTGAIYWDDWSDGGCNPLDWSSNNIQNCGADHDYNFSLLHGDYSGLTSVFSNEDSEAIGLQPGSVPGPGAAAMHVEFNSDESIDNWFQSPFWQHFRNLVEGGSGNVLLAGSQAVVTGALGIDAVHQGGSSELHPAFSMAFHDSPLDPDHYGKNQAGQLTIDQNWHFFIRTSGTEGTCSKSAWTWHSLHGTDYYIQLPWALDPDGLPALSVKWVAGQAWPWPESSNMPTPSYEIAQGKWVYLHFNMLVPPANLPDYLSYASGFDGNVTLEYTFAKGKYTKSERKVLATSPHPTHPAPGKEVDVDWAKALPKITDPAAISHLQRVLTPVKPATSTPHPGPVAINAGQASTNKNTSGGRGSDLLAKITADATRARHMDDLAAAAGFAPVTFQSVPGSQDVFVVDANSALWLDKPPFDRAPPARLQLDADVQTLQVLDPQTIAVLSTDGVLWLHHGSFGSLAATRQQIDTGVLNFRAIDSQNILVLDAARKLWLDKAPFGHVPPLRTQVDANVRGFRALDAGHVLVVDMADKLWLEQAPFGSVPPARQQLDANVWSFYSPQANANMFVLDSNDNLWLDEAPFGSVPPKREQIDSKISSFAALNNTDAVWALRQDGSLWLEQAPFPSSATNRMQIDGSVRSFEPVDASHVLVLGTDGNLWLEQGPFGKVPPTRVQIDSNVR